MGKGRCGYGKMFKRDSDQGNHSWLPFHFHIPPLYKRMNAENLPSLRAWLKREMPVQTKMSNENTMRHGYICNTEQWWINNLHFSKRRLSHVFHLVQPFLRQRVFWSFSSIKAHLSHYKEWLRSRSHWDAPTDRGDLCTDRQPSRLASPNGLSLGSSDFPK